MYRIASFLAKTKSVSCGSCLSSAYLTFETKHMRIPRRAFLRTQLSRLEPAPGPLLSVALKAGNRTLRSLGRGLQVPVRNECFQNSGV